ncbi:AMP-binding protein [Nocardia sp. NPDC051787]|uniref:AMP-binding protein n=1 Tax=Nocardia sp. NPDC051787 TaxID=3155415 RepID=UPI003435072E
MSAGLLGAGAVHGPVHRPTAAVRARHERKQSIPQAELARLVAEWSTGVEPTEVAGIAEVLERGRFVPAHRTALRCGGTTVSYGELFESLDRRTAVAGCSERAGIWPRVAAATAAVRAGAPLPVPTPHGRTVLVGAGALAAAAADRRSVAAECWENTDRATGSAHIRLLAAPRAGHDLLIELLAAIADGATLVVATDDEHADPAALAELIAEHSVTHVVADLGMLAAFDDIGVTTLPTVRRWDVAGTACPASLSRLLTALSPRSTARAAYRLPEYAGPAARGPLDGTGRMRPIPGARLLVLNHAGHPVPPGMVGEIYLGGVSLAHGYAEPAETAQRFVTVPFLPGVRLLRTGESARWTTDGWLVDATA